MKKCNKRYKIIKKILLLAVFSVFFIPSMTMAAGCTCATGTWPSYTMIGNAAYVSSADDCDQLCANRGAKHYCYNSSFCIYPPDVTKTSGGKVNYTTNPATSTSYTPMEEIPGFGKPTDFPEYLMAVYKFGLWIVGLSAMLMILIGGYMYLTSAGNNAAMGTAKKIITDAIAGLILALVSWILLYAINPDLTIFKAIQ